MTDRTEAEQFQDVLQELHANAAQVRENGAAAELLEGRARVLHSQRRALLAKLAAMPVPAGVVVPELEPATLPEPTAEQLALVGAAQEGAREAELLARLRQMAFKPQPLPRPGSPWFGRD
jgi:hypothetical protein